MSCLKNKFLSWAMLLWPGEEHGATGDTVRAVEPVDGVQTLDVARLQLVTQLDSDRLMLLSLQSRSDYLAAAIESANAVRVSYGR